MQRQLNNLQKFLVLQTCVKFLDGASLDRESPAVASSLSEHIIKCPLVCHITDAIIRTLKEHTDEWLVVRTHIQSS